MTAPNIKPSVMEKAFKRLGESKYGGVAVMCVIAVFKGIFRPMFTMMDKKSDPETKKYAAIREGLTEVAALPLYASVPILVGKLINKTCKGNKNIKRLEANGIFLGLGAATLIIPAVCNVIQPPIMASYKKRQEAKKAKIGAETNPVKKPVQTTFKGHINYGMKVGG